MIRTQCPFTRTHLAIALLAAGGVAAQPVVAQQLEEVIVTAQKRVESLQEAPLSVAAFSESMLEAQGIETLTDLTMQTPSLQAYDFPTSTSNISMFLRGFGNTDSQTLTIDNPIGIYVDGVYISRTSGATIALLDLERVEILRGPQGTLFGRNSSAGAVNFISKKPGDEFGGKFEVGVGEFNLVRAYGSLDVPITDTFRTKITYAGTSQDGWVENKGANNLNGQPGEDFYKKETQGGRIALTWDASDNVSVDYIYDTSDQDSTAPYYQQDASSRQEQTSHLFLNGGAYRYVLPDSNTETSGHNLTVEWAVNDNFSIKSITGAREMEERAIQNWSDSLFFATDVDWSTETFSQEFQFLGAAMDQKLEYILGLYYFEEEGKKSEEQFTNANSFAFDALAEPLASLSVLQGGNNLGIHTVDTDLESTAIFGQVTYTPEFMDSRWSFTLGLRYTEDERNATRGVDPSNPSIQFFPGSNDLSYDRTDYTAVVDYAFSDDVIGYVRVATGYRAGGSGERTLDFSQTFKEEDNISYEFGLKSELWDNRIRLNAALFFTEFSDYILTISGLPPTFASYVENFNAGEANVDGLELDFTGLLWAGGTVTFNYTYLDTELKDVVVPQDSFLLGGPPASPVNLRGTDISATTFIPFAPESAFSIAFDQSIPVGESSIDLHLNYSWRDELFSQPGQGLPVPELGLLNGRISWSNIELGSTRWRVSAWGRNLTDEAEVVYDLSGFGFQYNMPTTYGVDLTLEF